MNIVIIDDDVDAQDILSMHLKAEGYDLYPALTGIEGIQLTQKYDPDLVILDILLPQMDGWETCRSLRSFSSVPILMISAIYQADEDIVRGLNFGADDYLNKPIKPSVLRARVNALVRRSQDVLWRSTRPGYIDSHLKIDLYRQRVIAGGARLQLSSLEYRLLELLVINAEETVPVVEIVEELWSEHVEGNYARYVRIYIGRLRKLIEPDPQNPQYIITEHGLGYRFSCPV